MLTAKMIKDCAIAAGADLCGIASVERFQDAPKEMHPLTLFPEAKSVIVFANRILKGCYKGIQEGTDWSTYWIYGYGTGLYTSLGRAGEAINSLLEEHGYEGVHSPGSHTLLDEAPPAREPLAKGKLPPCVTLHMRVAAALAGLGEPGWSKVFLTPEFGPRQRFESILTDAELEQDPLFDGQLCDHCQACVRACPGHALGGERESVTCEGREFAWGRVNYGKCKVTHWGLNPKASPFVSKDLPGMNMDVDKVSYDWYAAYRLGFALAPRIKYLDLISTGSAEHGQGGRPGSVCGAVGCIQACNAHLEAKKVLRGGVKG
jgi:epoxyqueuosine reductase